MEMELTFLFKSFYWHLKVQAYITKIYSTSAEEKNKIRTKEMKQSSQCNI